MHGRAFLQQRPQCAIKSFRTWGGEHVQCEQGVHECLHYRVNASGTVKDQLERPASGGMAGNGAARRTVSNAA